MGRLARRAGAPAGPAARRCFASAVTVSLPSIAVVGTGRMGQLRVEGIKADGASRLGWVVDSDVAAAKALGDKWGTRHTGDLSEALADDTVDAVWLSTPTPTHVDLIMQSLAAGKAVVVEKPVPSIRELFPDNAHGGRTICWVFEIALDGAGGVGALTIEVNENLSWNKYIPIGKKTDIFRYRDDTYICGIDSSSKGFTGNC